MTTILTPTEPTIKSDLNEYQRKAIATRARRQAAGCYATPAQKAAFAKYMRCGVDGLTQNDLELLAANPCLTQNQRSRFSALAEAADYAEDIADRDDWHRGGW